jgi:D-alanyl-D-alanine carboxypeptidase/D-alanyl-D-alanine-endopeptidase (penicillin-binding protein 4)
MNKNFNHARIAIFLVSAFVFLGINFGASAQQDAVRQRTIEKPTPTVSPSPRQSPTPIVSPAVTPTPTQIPMQTLADLQSRIRLVLARPELRRGIVGIKIAALDTNKVVYEENAEKYLMPASNMKSFTVAAAIERLSPNFRFTTSVLANSQPDASGAIKGDLTIFGRGDVSLSTAFYEGDYYKGLDALADKIVAAGVKRVEGNLIADDSYFSGSAIPASWEWDDLQWYYGAEVSALPLNDNALDLSVKPSSSVNSPCLVQLQPFNAMMRVTNRCMTSAAGTKRDLTVKKDLDQNVLEVSGSMPVGDKPFANYLTVSRPAELFAALLRQRLQAKGVVVTGQTRVIGAKEKPIPASITTTAPPIEIARLESAPLSLIAAKTMKPSQNMYTETILWTLGEQGKNFANLNTATITPEANPLFNPKATSAEKGVFVVGNFLREIGVAPDSVIQWDGSGLSRHNLVTPAALVQLYTFMAKQSRNSQAWRDSLPIGGVDGTLQNRFKNTAAERNVRAKTGTIDQVSGLSGYVTTASGETLVFSIIVNGVNNTRTRTATIDEIVVHLANFNGRTN